VTVDWLSYVQERELPIFKNASIYYSKKPALLKTQEKVAGIENLQLTFEDTPNNTLLLKFNIQLVEGNIKGQKFFFGSSIYRFYTFAEFLFDYSANEYKTICNNYNIPVEGNSVSEEAYSPFKMVFHVDKITFTLSDNNLLKCVSNLKKGYKAFKKEESPDDIKLAYYNIKSVPVDKGMG
jgi:hypothetical protein